jgi:hypothetical protein
LKEKAMTQKEKWMVARETFLSAISSIDFDTEWSETEPEWWLEMMRVRDSVMQARDIKAMYPVVGKN